MFGDIQLSREDADARSLSARVGDLCPALDDVFGDAGRRLVDAVNALNSIITAFEGLPTALNDEQFQSARDTLRQVATRLGTIHQVMPREMALLNEMIVLGREIASRLQGLQRHGRTIEILAVNTRIESASLKEGTDEFSGFVSDLLRLAKAVKSITEEDLASHTEMATTLHSARAQLDQFDRQHQMQLPSFAQELERSLATIERRNATALAAAGDAGEKIRRVTAAIASAIMALQIGDSTRQRFEHVYQALNSLSPDESCSPVADPLRADLDELDRRALAVEIFHLQAAQLDGAVSDLDRNLEDLVHSLRQLIQDTTAIGRQGLSLYGSEHGQSASFLHDLSERLNVAGTLIQSCGQAGVTIKSVTEDVKQSFSGLSARIADLDDIVVDVQLIVLNGFLKSDRLGAKGASLSAITREVRDIARQISGSATELAEVLRKAQAISQELSKTSEELADESAESLAEHMADALSVFHRSGGTLGAAITMLSEKATDVSNTLTDTCGGLARLDEARRRALELSQALTAAAGAEPHPTPSQLVREAIRQFMVDRYTMAAERAIHNRCTGASLATETADAGEPAQTEADLDSILF